MRPLIYNATLREYTARIYEQNAVFDTWHQGNVIISRFPIHKHRNIDISTPRFQKRGLLAAELFIDTRPFFVLCVHLGRNRQERIKQAHAICDFIHHDIPHTSPIVLAGDFNDWKKEISPILFEKTGLKNT